MNLGFSYFLLDDIWIRIRIQEAQKQTDPTDPQAWFNVMCVTGRAAPVDPVV
jgi:hypothetical protein